MGGIRSIYVGAFRTLPKGSVDINGQTSALTIDTPTTSRSFQGLTSFAITLRYDLDLQHPGGVDLTESGQANAIVLDVNRFTSSYPWTFEVTARSSRGHYVSRQSIQSIVSPRSLVFPFDSFVVGRGAFDPDMDFTVATELSFILDSDLSIHYPESTELFLSAARLRTGLAVPESSSQFLQVIGMTMSFFILRRKMGKRRRKK